VIIFGDELPALLLRSASWVTLTDASIDTAARKGGPSAMSSSAQHAPIRRSTHACPHSGTCPADQPRIRNGVMGSAKRAGRDQRRAVAGEAGHTLWIRVVSMASARVITGRMVVGHRASIDLPAPVG
jgi:hypothetical protein